ncbi:MAG TPA: hypothetical protein PKI60_04505 [Oscillospiraceae bacterium]|nr:hypothetical protein [Oscillospiraceae bacterium]
MKIKVFVFSIVITLLFLFGSVISAKAEDEKIKLVLENSQYQVKTTSEIKGILYNNSKSFVLAGDEYQIDQLENGEYKKIWPPENTFWDMIGYGLDPGAKKNFKFSLASKGLEPLSVGKYRVSKGIEVDGEKSRVYVKFEIVEHLDISAGEGAFETAVLIA